MFDECKSDECFRRDILSTNATGVAGTLDLSLSKLAAVRDELHEHSRHARGSAEDPHASGGKLAAACSRFGRMRPE